MPMRTFSVYICCLIVCIELYSQSSINEIIISDSVISEQFHNLSRINENLYCIYNKNDTTNPYNQYQSRLLKLQPDGDTVWLDFNHIDSTIHFAEMIVNNSGNLLLAGNVYFQSGLKSKAHWFCEVSPDLNIIWEKGYRYEVDSIYTYTSCLGQYVFGNYLYVSNIRNLETSEVYMYAINISEQGDSVSNHVFDISVTGRINSITASDTNLTLHLEHSDYGSPYNCKLLTIDSKYNTLSFVRYPIMIFGDPFYTIINSTGDYLSFGTDWFLGDYFLKAITFDTTNGIYYNSNLTSGEEEVYAAWNKGIDYYYYNHIYVAGMYNVQLHWQEFPNTFYIACLSEDLSLKHDIILGGEHYYNIHDIAATSTGGVAVAGTIYDPTSNSNQHDAYLVILDSAVFVGQREVSMQTPKHVLEIYPNPVSSTATLKVNVFQSGKYTLEVFSISSTMAIREERYFTKGEQKITLNIGQLSPGIYVCSIKSNGKVIGVEKVVKGK